MEDEKLSNDHLMILTDTGLATKVQIEQVISDVLHQVNISTNFYINVVKKKDTPCGYAYVWIDDKKAFDLLIQFKDNGYIMMNRLIEIPNPEYVVNSDESDDTKFTDPTDFINKSLKTSWADIKALVSPTIKQITQVEIYLPVIHYTYDQIKTAMSEDEDWLNKPIIISIDKALIRDFRNNIGKNYDDEYLERRIHNKWIATGISHEITFDSLYNILRCYVSNPNKKGKVGKPGQEIWKPYPLINFYNTKDGKRNVYVTFDSDSTDGLFALAMSKQLRVKVNGKKYIVYFNHQLINDGKKGMYKK